MSTTITAEGNLVAEPDLRFAKTTGQAVCNLRIAVSTRRKNIDGEYEDTPAVFFDATCWGALAEHVAELHKGDRVLVHGSTHDEEWTDREGATRIKHVIQVTAVGLSLRYATATVHRANAKTGAAESQPEAEPVEAGA
jgi:single-strand DNA-binding protein